MIENRSQQSKKMSILIRIWTLRWNRDICLSSIRSLKLIRSCQHLRKYFLLVSFRTIFWNLKVKNHWRLIQQINMVSGWLLLDNLEAQLDRKLQNGNLINLSNMKMMMYLWWNLVCTNRDHLKNMNSLKWDKGHLE